MLNNYTEQTEVEDKIESIFMIEPYTVVGLPVINVVDLANYGESKLSLYSITYTFIILILGVIIDNVSFKDGTAIDPRICSVTVNGTVLFFSGVLQGTQVSVLDPLTLSFKRINSLPFIMHHGQCYHHNGTIHLCFGRNAPRQCRYR